MTWLGIDLGSCTGWCILDIDSGWAWYGSRDLRKDAAVDRVVQFGIWLDAMLLEERWAGDPPKPNAIVYEESPGAGRGRSLWIVHRQEGVLMYLAKGIPYLGVINTELKKWATGKGNATKEMMIEAAIQKLDAIGGWAFQIPNEHEADAILAAFWAAETVARKPSEGQGSAERPRTRV